MRWKRGSLWDPLKHDGENYLFDLKEQGFAIKFIRTEGERLVKDNVLTEDRFQEVLNMIAADTDQQIDADELSPNQGLPMLTDSIQTSDQKLTSEERTHTEAHLKTTVVQLQQLWDVATQEYYVPEVGTSQYFAYEQFVFRQTHGDPLIVCFHAGAGYGKSHFLLAFFDFEKLRGSRWALLAPSGVAAMNIGGVTVHFFFQIKMRAF